MRDIHHDDLHVVGAGPTGCIAAISAIRKRNANVVVSEEHQRSGVPVNCSGLFSIEGLETLMDYVDYRRTIVNEIRGAVLDFCGERITVRKKDAVAFVCDRAEFDLMVAEKAEKEGAKIEFGKKIKNENGINADNVIGADGPNSFVASHFGFPGMKKFAATAQTVVPYVSEDPHMVEVFLSNSKFPGFFGWIIPHNVEEAEFGCGVAIPNGRTNAMDALGRLLGMKKIVRNKNNEKESVKCAIIPIESRGQTAMRKNGKNILLVGDAAGQVKATTGGGVIFGGNCAAIAGKNFDNPLGYEIKWRARFGADLFIHSMVRNYVNGKDDSALRSLGARLKTSGLETFLSEHGHMDRPTKMIAPDALALGRILGNVCGLGRL